MCISWSGEGTLFCLAVHSLSCPNLCNSRGCSTPGSSVLHYFPEFAQIHVQWVGDTIQSSHPLLPSSPALNLSQNQGASVSVLAVNIQSWFPSGLTGLISLQSKGLSRVFFSTTIWKRKFFGSQSSIMVQLSHPCKTTRKAIALTTQTFVCRVMSLLFNTLSRFVIAFLRRNMHLLISWLQSQSAVILEPKK